MIILNERRSSAETLTVRAPFDGTIVGTVPVGTAADMDAAVAANVEAAEPCRRMPSHARAACLRRIAEAVRARREELATLLAREAGKPITQAGLELDRAIAVFLDGAEEATRIGGEVMPLDVVPAGDGRIGLTRRFPLSPIAAITPFNFPVMLAAHKVAPAIACGASLTLKPPPQDPLSTELLGEILAEAGYPAGGINVVYADLPVAQRLIQDDRVRMVSFTGSAKAGWALRAQAGTKRVALELGGNAGVIIEPDADLDRAIERCGVGGYAYAGQSCISVQRILVHQDVYDAFLTGFTARVARLRTGDPLDPATEVGPMIDEAAARRAESWIAAAVADGARVEVGGGRTGTVLQPTVLTRTRPEQPVNCEEVFAPVTTVTAYRNFTEAVEMLNGTAYGLQAGVFTTDVHRLMQAWDRLDVGGVMGNDIPSFRVDRMPYGGAKASGLGREGVRYAIQEMTEPRLLTLHTE